jgi:hypothetical protein
VLNDFEKSPLMILDPIGAEALALAERERETKNVLLRGVAGKVRRVFHGAGGRALTREPEEPTLIIPEVLASFPPVCVKGKELR